MRILLDKCVDESLRHAITGHDCRTCRYAGLKGLTNGRLLDAADHQQRLRGSALALAILEPRTTNIDDLLTLVPDLLAAPEDLKPGDVVRIARG